MAPNIWNRYAESAASQYGVPLEVVQSVIGAESSWRPGAVSDKGAGGLMQLMPDTFAELRQKHGLGPDRFDPETNIRAGTAYMRQMYDQFGNWNDALGAYNAGPGRWARVKAGTAAPPRETVDYVKKVTSSFGQGGNQTQQGGDMVPQLFGGFGGMPSPPTGNGARFSGQRAATEDEGRRWMNSAFGGGLLEFGQDKNFHEGLGLLNNTGQTPSQPPRTEGPVADVPAQTDRLGINDRLNSVMEQLLNPQGQRQQMGPGGYMMAGALGAVTPLAATRDRKVGIGELLGAMGGGLTRGAMAGEEAQREGLRDQLGNLVSATKLQEFQRDETERTRKAKAVTELARELYAAGRKEEASLLLANPSLIDKYAEQKFKAPEAYTLAPGAQRRDAAGNIIADNPRAPATTAPPAPVTLGDGPQGPGVYARNPDGTTGPRLGASETAPGTEIAETLTPELAQERGLPPPPASSPYSNPNLSPRGRSNLVEAERKRWEKRATDNGEGVKSAQSLITDMQRFQYLNSQTDTGGITGSPIGGAVRSLYDSNIKEMNSIRDRITPSLRQPGSGATSDFDARMFQGGTVGVDKPKQVNDNIATATIEGGKNLIAKAQFEQAYFDSYQHTAGMEAAWQKYLNDNPIFDPKAEKGSYQLNQNRVDWQTYFRNGMKASEPGRPQAPMSGGEGGSSVPPPPPGATIIQ